MTRRFSTQGTGITDPISVVKLDKSGGCVDRDSRYLEQLRQDQIREYFFGDARTPLSPHIQLLDFSEATIYRTAERKSRFMLSVFRATKISTESTLLDSLLPGGEVEYASKKAIFDKVQPSSLMQNCLLALVQAEPNDAQENIRDASVIGFVYVAEVDEKKKKVRILAPLSGRLPRKAMLWGTWPESAGELVG